MVKINGYSHSCNIIPFIYQKKRFPRYIHTIENLISIYIYVRNWEYLSLFPILIVTFLYPHQYMFLNSTTFVR